MPSVTCHACGAPATVSEPVARDAECDACRRDLRCCMNCRHYDPGYNNACRETMADPIEDKDRRNFCEYFLIRQGTSDSGKAAGKQAEARARLDQLFGGKCTPPAAAGPSAREKLEAMFGGPPADRAQDARKKLDDLFRKGEAPAPDAEE